MIPVCDIFRMQNTVNKLTGTLPLRGSLSWSPRVQVAHFSSKWWRKKVGLAFSHEVVDFSISQHLYLKHIVLYLLIVCVRPVAFIVLSVWHSISAKCLVLFLSVCLCQSCALCTPGCRGWPFCISHHICALLIPHSSAQNITYFPLVTLLLSWVLTWLLVSEICDFNSMNLFDNEITIKENVLSKTLIMRKTLTLKPPTLVAFLRDEEDISLLAQDQYRCGSGRRGGTENIRRALLCFRWCNGPTQLRDTHSQSMQEGEWLSLHLVV